MLSGEQNEITRQEFEEFFLKLTDYFGKDFGNSLDVAKHAYWQKIKIIPLQKMQQALVTIFTKTPVKNNFPSADEILDICGMRQGTQTPKKIRKQSQEDVEKIRQLSLIPKMVNAGFTIQEIQQHIKEGSDLLELLQQRIKQNSQKNYAEIIKQAKQAWAIGD